MADISSRFFATSGSVTGREHARLGRNNQDGVALAARGDLLVAVVTDGCSSGKWSEVGARIAARWLVEWTPHYLRPATGASRESELRDLTTGLLRYLVMTGSWLSANEESWMATLQDYFLFTFLVAVVTPAETLVFGIGDGVLSVNGRITVVDPGPDNAPPYVVYNLTTRALPASLRVAPIVHCRLPTRALRSLIIATDGASELVARQSRPLTDGTTVGGLEPFETESRYVRNPSLLHKRLVVIGDRHRCLFDDTTLVLIRRKEEE